MHVQSQMQICLCVLLAVMLYTIYYLLLINNKNARNSANIDNISRSSMNKLYNPTNIPNVHPNNDEPIFNMMGVEGFETPQIDYNNEAKIQKLATGINTNGYNIEITPENNGFDVSFRGVPEAELPTGYKIKGYILVAAQFDSNLRKSGHLNIRLSNEMITEAIDNGDGSVNSSATGETTSPANSLDNAIGGTICNKDGVCRYRFQNLHARDPQTNELIYYRLGVGIVYLTEEGEEKHSRLLPYGFGSGRQQEYFRIDIDTETQSQLLRRMEAIQSRGAISGLKEMPSDSDSGNSSVENVGMDAYMRMLRPHLGNYPDEFLMSSRQQQDASLEKYMQESLAVGKIDVNVNIPDIVDELNV